MQAIFEHLTAWVCLLILLFGSAVDAKNSGRSQPPPTNNALALSCGSADGGGKDSDGRKWDSDSKFRPNDKSSVVAKAETQPPSLPPDVPYMSARIFTVETSYEFPNPNASRRVLLRFHFYPASYPGFDISKSSFSVSAGGFTLLSNFRAAEAHSQGYIIREYFLAPIDSPTLRVTFKPDSAESFAFVNGIEVISLPEMFNQDTQLIGFGGSQDDTTLLGEVDNTISIASSSMQTMFRINVGGQNISAVKDSGGLMRSWYDDTPYLFGRQIGVASQDNGTVDYKKLPEYIAPLDVYRTARSMGPDPNVNKNFNLTWVFPVDSNFAYLVRLHWCDWEMDLVSQRMFSVFIDQETAEDEVDIFGWTNEKATPMKKDYVVYVTDNELSVQLRPLNMTGSQYFDSLLNGLEIFKLSDSKLNLGPKPSMSSLSKEHPKPQKKHRGSAHKAHSGGGAAGGAAHSGGGAAGGAAHSVGQETKP